MNKIRKKELKGRRVFDPMGGLPFPEYADIDLNGAIKLMSQMQSRITEIYSSYALSSMFDLNNPSNEAILEFDDGTWATINDNGRITSISISNDRSRL